MREQVVIVMHMANVCRSSLSTMPSSQRFPLTLIIYGIRLILQVVFATLVSLAISLNFSNSRELHRFYWSWMHDE